MNPKHGWTKEMIDKIKDREFINGLPIIIKVQKYNYEFADKERDEIRNLKINKK